MGDSVSRPRKIGSGKENRAPAAGGRMESQPVGASCGRLAGAPANDTLRLALCGSFAGRIERQPPRPLCGAGLCAACTCSGRPVRFHKSLPKAPAE